MDVSPGCGTLKLVALKRFFPREVLAADAFEYDVILAVWLNG